MSALGLAIMIVAGAVTLDVVLENTNNTDASVVGQTIANVDLGGFFTAGVLVGVALMIGLMLLLAGVKRANRKRMERKELARSYEGTAAQAETLQDERDRLAAELEQERAARHGAGRGTVAAGTAAGTGAAGTTAADHPEPARGGRTSEFAPESQAGNRATTQEPVGSADPMSSPNAGAPIYPTEASSPTAQNVPVRTEEPARPGLKARLLGR